MSVRYREIRDALLREIASGALKEGDAVPSEFALAKRFGVSRITSRKALDTLRQDGVVVREQGRGTFVASGIASSGRLPLPSTPRRVAFVVPDMSDTFGLRMFNGIDERCRELGLQLVVRRTSGNADEETAAIREFTATGIDGLIVFPVHGEFYNAELLRHVLDGYPVVLVDRVLPGIPVSTVCTDNVAAARTLTERLIGDGHRTIGFISPPANRTSSIEQRRQGVRAACDSAGVANPVFGDIEGTLPGTSLGEAWPRDRERVLAFLDAWPDVTAIVACEYTIAVIVERAVRESGRPMPVIASFDAEWDPFDRHRFLHVRQREREIGRQAVDMLVDHIAGAVEARTTTVDWDVVEASHGIVPVMSARGASRPAGT
jgi:DNA-binding LacI/PurR family transcriptional regulator